jgi:hypothetical protein
MFEPALNDIMLFIGTCGFFTWLFLVFIRFLPVIAIAEVKGVVPEADPHHHDKDHKGGHHV